MTAKKSTKSISKTSRKQARASKKATRYTPKRVSNGKASVAKGRKFEDEVADLYRLLGAEVIQNIEISQKKVDILAIFPIQGSPIKHRVIVECKDERRAVNANQRVMQFKGLLDVARQTGEADSAEIITRVAWGDAAKGFAYKAGISLLTYTEKLSQLIDFSNYLKVVINKFEKGDPARPSEPPLGAYYVDLSAEVPKNGKPQRVRVVDTYVNQWLVSASTLKHLAIFGEYGAGKSSLCQKIARDLATQFLVDPNSSRIPILLNLREFIGTVKIEAFITAFLDQECKVANPRFELFKAMNDAGIFLIIFDGFDEMAVRVDADILEMNMMEIEKLAASPKARVLLTSRPEYFITAEEERQTLSPELNLFRTREAEYEPIKLLPWDEKQIEEFLKRRVPLVKGANQPWTVYRNKIRSIRSLSDLSQRPVLLDMIVKTLPKLIESNTVINLPNLYKTYLSEEIKRQKILKKRTLLLSEAARFSLLRDLAIEIYSGSTSSINFTDTLSRIDQTIKPPKQELEAYTREFLTNSFLIRKGDKYSFSHKSIAEYLVATKLNEEIQTGRPTLFGNVLLQRVIIDFLKELEPNRRTLFSWIGITRKRAHSHGKYLGGNAATLLCALSSEALNEEDLSRTNLTGVDFSLADLRRTKFDGAIIRNGRLVGAKFDKNILSAAKLSDMLLTYYLKLENIQRIKQRLDPDPAEHVWKLLTVKAHSIWGKEAGMLMSFGPVLPRRSINDNEVFLSMVIEVKTIEAIEIIKTDIAEASKGRVALYYDEIKQLGIPFVADRSFLF